MDLSKAKLMMNRTTLESGDYVIESSQQAEELSSSLYRVWSDESRLTQRTLIYLCKLLERTNALLEDIDERSDHIL